MQVLIFIALVFRFGYSIRRYQNAWSVDEGNI